MHQLTLAEIARGLADKQFSAEELSRSLLARINQLDPQLNSFITVTAVSYTHLDVYKRQRPPRSARSSRNWSQQKTRKSR